MLLVQLSIIYYITASIFSTVVCDRLDIVGTPKRLCCYWVTVFISYKFSAKRIFMPYRGIFVNRNIFQLAFVTVVVNLY